MRIIIIGGGPGGYTAAFEAARRGCEVTLIEQNAVGGTCLHRGCIPTKTLRASADALTFAARLSTYGVTGCTSPHLDMAVVQARVQYVVDILRDGLEKACARHKIRLLHGSGRLESAHSVVVHGTDGDTQVSGDALILATGSGVRQLPGLAFDSQHICSSDDAVHLTHVPRQLIIVGGGVIGCEMACIYRAFGSAVTIVEGTESLLPMPSVDADVRALLLRELRKQHIRVHTGRTLTQVRVEQGMVRAAAVPASPGKVASADVFDMEADTVLVTVGRIPVVRELGLEAVGVAVDAHGWITVDAMLQTSVPGIYAVGDILGPGRPMLAHVAAAEGLHVIESLCGAKPTELRYDAVPSAIFTSPEIGEVGLSEEQARAQNHRIVCGTTPMRLLGKAHAMGELPGFFKVVADADSGRVLGVHCVGAHASDIVAEAGLALTAGLDVWQLAHTIHAHPTLAEGLVEAARAAGHALQGESTIKKS